MTRLIVTILFLLFAGLVLTQNEELQKSFIPTGYKSSNNVYTHGILNNDLLSYKEIANYNFKAELNPNNKLVTASEKLVWFNKTQFSTKELYFHLYPNGYKDGSEFSKAYNLNVAQKSFLKILRLKVNGEEKNYSYDFKQSRNSNDSTVIKIDLDYSIEPNDSVEVQFDFLTKIPLSLKRFGYAEDRNFFFISQWFPKIGVFEDGSWVCPPYYSYTNYYADFGNYEAELTIPSNYKIGATAIQESAVKNDSLTTYKFIQNGIHDFAWFATDSILYKEYDFKRGNDKPIKIQLFVQPERDEYFGRYKNALENSLDYFEKYVGKYPYEKITLVDVPRTSRSGGMEYPTLITVSADLFSPIETGYPEKLVAHEFSHQYFYGIIANNETYEGWIDEGLASYFATKVINEYYPSQLINFKLAGYFPVFGIQLLSYNEIPLIYSVDKYIQAPAYRSFINYYKDPIPGKISDSSFIHESKIVYRNTNYVKPELMFISLERILGEKKFLNTVHELYDEYKFKHPTGSEFIDIIKSNSENNLDWFFQNVFYSDVEFDYLVKSIRKESQFSYKVDLLRKHNGVFYNDVLFVTENDSIWKRWEDSSRTKSFEIKSDSELIGVEIDPLRKNVFDQNFANNSLKTSSNIWPALSLSIRWFFWIQNALMVLGSFG